VYLRHAPWSALGWVATAGCTALAPLGGLTGGGSDGGGMAADAAADATSEAPPNALDAMADEGPTDGAHAVDADTGAGESGIRGDGGPPPAPVALVQRVPLVYMAALMTSVQLPTPVTAGDLLAVAMLTHDEYPDAGPVTYGMSDSLGNAWKSTKYRDCSLGSGGAQIWYVESSRPGVDVVTATQTYVGPTGSELAIAIFEYRGLASSGTLDVESSQCAPVTTTAMSSPGIVTTAQDLLVGLFVDPCGSNETLAPGSGYTGQDVNTQYFYLFEDDQNGGAGVPAGFHQATATDPVDGGCWLGAIASFKVQ
jgi:hypothetical protein